MSAPPTDRPPDPDRVFWTLTALLVALDAWTKRLAEAGHPWLDAIERASATVSFPLMYNPGVAFSLRVGGVAHAERWVHVMLATWVLVFLYALYRRVSPASPASMAGLALMHGGAAGNLLDRVRGQQGVVDFIHVDAGVLSGFVFNLADVAAVGGGALLLLALARRECAPEEVRTRSGRPGAR
ncbi:signal peptidase II [Roseisolibacter sp. H3M3-2]|uniref:signal peptidase II n=1 Tax=Roseisolibacter sp. H3M3-2 TaxID=3031323 RepID=UPI0023DAABF0|nr:signal peptidase II [Roseisolibacter sp. H3M3-2]MDF1502595.1 signal peptidase II [Roseisolibacter sp. H3M3-2]